MLYIYQFIILICIVAIKAIFTSADTAFTYLNRAEITQLSKKDKKAKKIKILMEDSNKFFGIIEVGINMSELIASAFVSLTFVEQFSDVLEEKMNTTLAMLFSVILITVILSYILLVFGGVLPKRIARNKPKKVAYRIVPILWIVAKLNYPFEKIIDFSTNIFSKILRISKEPEEKLTEKQLKMIIREAKDEGVIANTEKNIAIKALTANNTRVWKIMIPIDKVILININDNISNILENIEKAKYSRIPVYENKKENIIGILNIKDIVINYSNNLLQKDSQIREILRNPLYINKDEKILSVFKKMQKNNHTMAVITDEGNTPLGIITIEDILERLVGKIFDEDDKIE